MTLYGRWTEDEVPQGSSLLIFDANGGTVSPTSKIIQAGQNLDLLIPIREGYEFDGWYTNLVRGEKLENSNQLERGSRQVVYAHWKNVTSCFKVGPNAMEGYYENGHLTRCFFAWYNLKAGYGERLSGGGTQCVAYSTNDYNPLAACTAPDQSISCVDVLGSECKTFSGFSLKAACNYEIRLVGDDEAVSDAKWFKDYPRFGGGSYIPETYDCSQN